jgi:hypothetical protein
MTSNKEDVTAVILKEHVKDLLLVADQVGMSDWERNFLQDMDDRRSFLSLSPKQKQAILTLAEKYEL